MVLISGFWQFTYSNFSWERCYIEWLRNNKQKESRLILCVYTRWKSTKKWRTLIHIMITKQQVKNEQIKRKQTCYLCFVNVFKFQENKFKIVRKNFYKIKITLIKNISWKSHRSQWSLHDKHGRSKAEDWR